MAPINKNAATSEILRQFERLVNSSSPMIAQDANTARYLCQTQAFSRHYEMKLGIFRQKETLHFQTQVIALEKLGFKVIKTARFDYIPKDITHNVSLPRRIEKIAEKEGTVGLEEIVSISCTEARWECLSLGVLEIDLIQTIQMKGMEKVYLDGEGTQETLLAETLKIEFSDIKVARTATELLERAVVRSREEQDRYIWNGELIVRD